MIFRPEREREDQVENKYKKNFVSNFNVNFKCVRVHIMNYLKWFFSLSKKKYLFEKGERLHN